jgi:hypothetical protein
MKLKAGALNLMRKSIFLSAAIFSYQTHFFTMSKFLQAFFVLTVLCLASYGQCNLSKPANLTIVTINSCSAKLSWQPVSGASYYQLRYKQAASQPWNYINTGMSTSWLVTNLLPNKSYSFSVASFCSNNTTKGFTPVVKKKTTACSQPLFSSVSDITVNSVVISWIPD